MKKDKLRKNFIYNIIYQVLVLILPLVTAPYLTRIIGGDSIGIYSYTNAFANYFVLISMLGVESYGNREIARVRDDKNLRDKTFWSIFLIQFSLTIILSIIYVSYLVIMKPPHTLIYLLQFFYIISSAFNINWFFFGMEKFKLTVTRNMIIKILTTISIFIFVKDINDLWLYTLIISIGTLLSNIIIWPFLLKEVRCVKISWRSVVPHIKPDIVLFLPVIAVSLYNIMDKIMLGNMSNYTEVGFYTYAEKIVQVPVQVIIALGTVMMPHVSNLFSKGLDEKCRVLFDKSILFVIFASTSFTFGMANLAPIFSDWYYGDDFSRCGLFITYLSPVIIFKSLANLVRTQYIIPKGLDYIYILSVSLGAVVNLIINSLLIPRYAGFGAIIGTIVAEFVVCFVQVWNTRKALNFTCYLEDISVFIIFGVIMYWFMNIFGSVFDSKFLLVNIFFRSSVGLIIFLSLSAIYLLLIKKDSRAYGLITRFKKR